MKKPVILKTRTIRPPVSIQVPEVTGDKKTNDYKFRKMIRDFAYQTKQSGKGPTRTNGHSNLYFEGKVLYSYGSHFPLARVVGGAGRYGGPFVMMRPYDDAQYRSNTTGKHWRKVREALSVLNCEIQEGL
jgi:hypothetical protein